LASGQARAVVTVKDGSVVTSDVTRALGSLERPMSDDQLSEKFRKLACYRLTEEATAELLQACWAIAAVDEVGQLARSAALP
jgi:2-methylcitrate dehydratase PrpD